MPQAETERQKYATAVTTLSNDMERLVDIKRSLTYEITVINKAVAAVIGDSGNYVPTIPEGEYFGKYEIVTGLWVASAKRIRTSFYEIETELNVRITNVQAEIENIESQITSAGIMQNHWEGLTKNKVWVDP